MKVFWRNCGWVCLGESKNGFVISDHGFFTTTKKRKIQTDPSLFQYSTQRTLRAQRGRFEKTWRGVRFYHRGTSRLSYTTTTVFAKLERRWSYFVSFLWNSSRWEGTNTVPKLFRVHCSELLARRVISQGNRLPDKKTVACICVLASLAGHFWKIVSWYPP